VPAQLERVVLQTWEERRVVVLRVVAVAQLPLVLRPLAIWVAQQVLASYQVSLEQV
jgi:hypothetical protein